MSATQVGQVYQKIIDDVIGDSALSFDETGVERALLDTLKTTWQEKLSARQVSTMLWDPPTAPTPLVMESPAPAPAPAAPVVPAVKPEPVVKQEPSYPEYSSNPNTMPASQRAGQFIQDKFGNAANGSLNALQSVTARAQTQQAQQAAQAQLNGTYNMSADASRQAYNRMLAEQMKQQQARVANQQRTVANGQTDGADEWRAFVAERRALSDEAVLARDISLRERIQQVALEREGGGLMLPASKVKISRLPVRRNPDLQQSQLDGNEDDEDKKDDDEDAINSDLDDPDDDQGAGSDDDENNGEVMICLYDKVQRVKNKWKCTLKDGILSTGGKEYVFGKAQGEFEW